MGCISFIKYLTYSSLQATNKEGRSYYSAEDHPHYFQLACEIYVPYYSYVLSIHDEMKRLFLDKMNFASNQILVLPHLI